MVLLLLILSLNSFAESDFSGRIIPRSDWGARPEASDISIYSDYGVEVPEPNKIVLHNANRGHGEGHESIKAIQDFQTTYFGWSDVGYNFLIDSAGNIYEGRKLYFIPSHAGRSIESIEDLNILADPDYGAIGIALLGESFDSFSTEQEEAAVELINHLRSQYPSITQLMTHSEVKSYLLHHQFQPVGDYDDNVCPGFGTRENIKFIRSFFPDLAIKFEIVEEPEPEVESHWFVAFIVWLFGIDQ